MSGASGAGQVPNAVVLLDSRPPDRAVRAQGLRLHASGGFWLGGKRLWCWTSEDSCMPADDEALSRNNGCLELTFALA